MLTLKGSKRRDWDKKKRNLSFCLMAMQNPEVGSAHACHILTFSVQMSPLIPEFLPQNLKATLTSPKGWFRDP